MALKKCRECGHQVSNKAKICPSCGIKSPGKDPLIMVLTFAGIFMVMALLLTSNEDDSPQKPQQKTNTEISGSHVSDSFVCKASTAENMGRKVKTMSSEKVGDKYHITHIRSDDNTKWGVYCWIEGNRVLWQTDGANSGGSPGRIRNHSADEKISFSAVPNRLTVNINFADGSGHSQVYKIPEGQ
jgi:hypothetical protein